MLAHQLPAPPDSAQSWSEAPNIFTSFNATAPPAWLDPAPPGESEEMWRRTQTLWSSDEEVIWNPYDSPRSTIPTVGPVG